METNKITYRLIEQYIQGALDEKTMHEIERQALDDPFLADAIEGYSHKESTAGAQISLLQKQLEERIALQQEKKNAFYFSWQRISVAAAACLLFISASILFWMKGSRNSRMETKEREVQVSLMPADSVIALTGKKVAPDRIATPAGGWTKFKQYLKENRSVDATLKGKVVVSFSIDPQGKPYNIKIVESANAALNNDAEKLIKNGPKWQTKDNPIVVKIDF